MGNCFALINLAVVNINKLLWYLHNNIFFKFYAFLHHNACADKRIHRDSKNVPPNS